MQKILAVLFYSGQHCYNTTPTVSTGWNSAMCFYFISPANKLLKPFVSPDGSTQQPHTRGSDTTDVMDTPTKGYDGRTTGNKTHAPAKTQKTATNKTVTSYIQ
jgi:hypothetical protein